MKDFNNMTTIYTQAIKHFGESAQTDMLIEEMAELTQALLKKRRGKEHNVEEEFADVEILMNQIYQTIDGEKVLQFREAKLKRLEKLINEQPPLPRNTIDFSYQVDLTKSRLYAPYVGKDKDYLWKILILVLLVYNFIAFIGKFL